MVNNKDYRDGVKALLDLKNRDDDKDASGDGVDGEDDKKDENNVEVAVLRYVGGTLGTNKKKRKKSFTNNDEMNEFQHWNAFLNTDQLQQGDDVPSTGTSAQVETPRAKKQRKGDVNVDPELTQLDDTADHEQLVRAAIRDANELAQGVDIQDFIHQPQDDQEQHGGAIDNNLIRATAAAVVGQQQQQQLQQSQQQKQPHRKQQKLQPHHDEVQRGLQKAVAKKDDHATGHQKTKRKHTQQTTKASEQSDTAGINAPSKASMRLAVAIDEASASVQNKPQGVNKMFTKDEIQAIDKFIEDYCIINGLTRKQICERVWSNERKKDDFWDLLHKVLPYRTRASVYKHVRRSYHVFENRGKWTSEDDQELARLAAEKDGQWKLIGEILGRMPEDCRDRWRNYVKCGKNRAQNKWTTEEEEKLRTVIESMIALQTEAGAELSQEPGINWTTVSEEMGGVRSRIQCRYKWNKLLRREALAKALSMKYDDRIWLLNKLQEIGEEPRTDEDWNKVASLHEKNYWTGKDMNLCYEKMRASIKDYKKKDMKDICHILLQDFVQLADHKPNAEIRKEIPIVLEQVGPTPKKSKKHKSKSSTSQTTSNHEQLYDIWR